MLIRSRSLLVLTLTTALSRSVLLHAEEKAPTPVLRQREPDSRVERPAAYRLANGLSVVLRPDPTRSDVEVSLRYAVGSADDPPGYAGLAHLVEHLTFRGSRHLRPLEAYSALEKVGASSISGRTGLAETVYSCVVPSNQLETALWVRSSRKKSSRRRSHP